MAENGSGNGDITGLHGHGVIAGFGVPGRAVAEWLKNHGVPFVVIEANEKIVSRCAKTGVQILYGDVRDEKLLRAAGIERASLFAIAVPAESASLEAVAIARRLNPNVRIIARCTYISGGLEATRRGAEETIVAEEVVATEFVRRLEANRVPAELK
jgi:voltage-gated potassium channel Kch